MKRQLMISFCMLLIIDATAQFERPVLSERTQTIKKTTVLTPPPPPPSNLTPGKDLSIVIKSFQFDPSNGSNINIVYTVRNNGTEAVDINGVSIQGFIDGPQDIPAASVPNEPYNGKNYFAAGGHSLATFSTILGPGQEREGTLRCFNLSRNIYFNNSSNYSYLLTIDKSNKVAEANENNNAVSYAFRGYQGQYQPSVTASDYYLTDVFVTVKTGADNKEMESEVNFRLIPSSSKNVAANDHNEFIKKIAKNEIPFFSNSSRTLPMALFMSSTARTVNPATSLEAFKQNGLGFLIEYKPNLVLDAWKIEQVQLVLCFKDANGIYHPTEGRKTITFNMPANTFLDGFFKHFLALKTDQSFNPTSTRVIEKLSDF